MVQAPEGTEFHLDKMVDKTGGTIDTLDPQAAFDAMSSAEQNRVFGRAAAQVIRDGADPAQVVNIGRHSGLYGDGAFTREGKTINGGAGAAMWRDYLTKNPQTFATDKEKWSAMSRYLARQDRLTPTEIVRRAGDDAAERLRLLKVYGYLQP